MIDTSGSMQGFQTSPRFANILALLSRLCAEHYSFGVGLHEATGSLDQLSFKDKKTELGPSLDTWSKSSSERRLYILTDNIADDGSGQADPGQAQFYSLLRSRKLGVERIAAILMRLPFSGAIYSANDRHTGFYPNGPRALMLYVLQRSGPSIDPSFDPSALGLPAQDLTVLQLEPFEAAGEALDAVVSSDQRNVSLDDGVITLSRKSAGDTYTFELQVRVHPSSRWDFGGLPLTATLFFPAEGPFTVPASTPCDVTPATAPPGAAVFQLNVHCTAPSATSSVPDATLKKLGNQRAERAGSLVVQVIARSTQINLGPGLRAWSFDGDGDRLAEPDPAVQGSIYRLGELLTEMSPADVRPMVMSAPVVERLYFFDPAPFVIGFVVLAALGGLLVVAVALAAPRMVEVTGGAGAMIRREVRFFAAVDVPLAERRRATVWVTPVALLVQGPGSRPHLLPAEGGDCALGKSGQLTVRVRRAQARATSPPRRPRRARGRR